MSGLIANAERFIIDNISISCLQERKLHCRYIPLYLLSGNKQKYSGFG